MVLNSAVFTLAHEFPVYNDALGTEETGRKFYSSLVPGLLQSIKGNKSPIKVNTRNFGLVAAAYQAAYCIELPQILSKHIKGKRFETDLWKYFF